MSTNAIQTPEVADIAELMQGLLGLEVEPATDCPQGEYSIAEYRNESEETVAYIACDLLTGCRLGAALTQIPAPRVDEAVATGQMPENVAENLDEIFNISVNLIANPDQGRVTFGGATHGEITDEMRQKIEALESVEFGFQVERYGNCRLVISS